ncbi:hypothetical protein JHK85_041427 [Glycine max]|nr:hypothetical protein JHK85_041427 [Glycine max]
MAHSITADDVSVPAPNMFYKRQKMVPTSTELQPRAPCNLVLFLSAPPTTLPLSG